MKTKKNNMRWSAMIIAVIATFSLMNVKADVLSRSVIVKEAKESKEYKSLSKDYSTIDYNNEKYYESKGRYYVESGENYKVVAPPVGIHVSKLPKGYSSFTMVNDEFYCCRGVIYKDSTSGGYEIINPEVGMTLPDLPEAGVREVLIDGALHYEASGFVYKSISDGEHYVVICTLESLNS